MAIIATGVLSGWPDGHDGCLWDVVCPAQMSGRPDSHDGCLWGVVCSARMSGRPDGHNGCLWGVVCPAQMSGWPDSHDGCLWGVRALPRCAQATGLHPLRPSGHPDLSGLPDLLGGFGECIIELQ